MQDLIKDLSVLTATDRRTFDKIVQNAIFCICDYLENAALNNERECSIDIGLGCIKLKIDEDTIRYSFIPSHNLETGIVNTLENQQNLLVSVIDSALINKLNKLYDNLL